MQADKQIEIPERLKDVAIQSRLLETLDVRKPALRASRAVPLTPGDVVER